jgi:tRNA(Ile)-lysidine synthase TilS/MesJ
MDQTMQCSKCRDKGIIFQPYSGKHLCHEHFIMDFEAKAKRVIREYRWIRPQDTIAIPISGEPSDNALLFFIRKLIANRRDIRVVEIPATEERSGALSVAQSAGATKIALSTPLEDAAVSILTTILKGDMGTLFTEGTESEGHLPLIIPFCHIPAAEIALYARIHGLAVGGRSRSPDNHPLDRDVKDMLINYSIRHPAAPHAVLNLGESLKRIRAASDEGEIHGT